MKKSLSVCAAAIIVSLALVACGSSSKSSSSSTSTPAPAGGPTAGGGGGASTLKVAADPSALKFDTSSLSAKAGKVTVDFNNPSAIGHDVVIEDQSGKELAKTNVIQQSKATTTANLQPGTYTFFCSVDSHRQAGMEGTLTVK
jgi:plastocyanin